METFKNLDKYLELWDIFNKELEKQKLSLQAFSQRWVKVRGEGDGNFYEKIKKQRKRKNEERNVSPNSLGDIKSYIEFINNDFKVFEVFEDEKFGNLFS